MLCIAFYKQLKNNIKYLLMIYTVDPLNNVGVWGTNPLQYQKFICNF